MAEEQQTAQTPETGSAPERRTNQGRQRSVMQYIIVLFAAAFILLLVTFLMERRQNELQQQENQASIDDLQQQSISAYQTLQGLMEENTQLKDQAEELQQQIDALEEQLTHTEEAQAAAQEQLRTEEKRIEAMTWFWELNDAYIRGRLTACQDIITSMEEAGAVELLPSENPTGLDYLSPAERYQEIYERVIK